MQIEIAKARPIRQTGRDIAVGGTAALLSAGLILTDCFAHPSAMSDYLSALLGWTHRGAVADLHRHAWSYYFGVLFWSHADHRSPVFSEGLYWRACDRRRVGGIFAEGRGSISVEAAMFLRTVSLYTVVLATAYSAIPYKTPWCALSVETGLILVAGTGAGLLLTPGECRIAAGALLLLGTGQLGWQAARDVGALCADSRQSLRVRGHGPGNRSTRIAIRQPRFECRRRRTPGDRGLRA